MSAIVGRNKEVDELKTQIDLLIQRKDNVVNMCEMKFYSEEFAVDNIFVLTHTSTEKRPE